MGYNGVIIGFIIGFRIQNRVPAPRSCIVRDKNLGSTQRSLCR